MPHRAGAPRADPLVAPQWLPRGGLPVVLHGWCASMAMSISEQVVENSPELDEPKFCVSTEAIKPAHVRCGPCSHWSLSTPGAPFITAALYC